jgi:RNA polymerase-interacting CarD/CdnL/TRCF family regulator
LGQIWDVLGEHPEPLPADHEQRYELLRDRLREGNALRIAAALRDIAWREQTERRLTKQGKQIYEESLMLLAGEIAIVQESELGAAEAQIVEALRKNVPTDATA